MPNSKDKLQTPARSDRWINRNPGVFAAIVAFTLIAPSYLLWYQANQKTNDTVDCIVSAFSDRDTISNAARNAAINWLDEFIQFLETIEAQTSVDPLLESAIDYRNQIEKTGVVVSVTALEECL